VTATKSRSERFDFTLLCLFVLSQAFTVPLFAVGPSWAAWPTAGDIVVAAMIPIVVVRMYTGAGRTMSKANKRILALLLVLLVGCMCSYVILCRAMPVLYPTETGRASEFGEYQIYRIVQAVLTYFFASQIDLTPRRKRSLSFAAVTALVIVCAALFLEYLGIVPASTYARHLPNSLSIAGPWGYYATANQPEGYGTISYTHAYSSSQVLLLLVLCLLLNPRARNFTRAALVFVAEAAILASGCRAVLAGSLVFLTALFIHRPRMLASFSCILLAVAALTAGLAPSAPDLLRPALDRASDLNPFADIDVEGRAFLWSDQIQYLNERPLRWIIGAGFGTSAGETGNDNILYLQIINETGVLGLAAFVFVFGEIFRQLYRTGPDSRPMIFGAIAILAASVGQETLYPVPAMGQFIAFYTLCLALALRPAGAKTKYALLVWTIPVDRGSPLVPDGGPLNLESWGSSR
jgi:hypothetical protein